MFEPQDEGKTVVDSADRSIGIVEEVVHGSAFVKPISTLDSSTRSALGWGGDARRSYRLDEGRIAARSNSEIVLDESY